MGEDLEKKKLRVQQRPSKSWCMNTYAVQTLRDPMGRQDLAAVRVHPRPAPGLRGRHILASIEDPPPVRSCRCQSEPSARTE